MRGEDKRRFPRHPFPVDFVVVDSPALAGAGMVPRDISVAGLGIELGGMRTVGEVFDFTFALREAVFETCQAKVVWARESGSGGAAWNLGLYVSVPEPRREEFIAAMGEILSAA